MNSRRGSTTSPISLVKMSSASSTSLTRTWSSEPPRDIGRRGGCLVEIVGDGRREHARNRGLLDDLAIVAAVQAGEHVADGARLHDDAAQVLARAFLAGIDAQHRLLEAGIDQE